MTVHRALQILGLEIGAGEAEIRQAYRDHVQIWHPDKHSSNPRLQKLAEEKTKELNLAFETLRNVSFQTKSWSTNDEEYFSQSVADPPPYHGHYSSSEREQDSEGTHVEWRGSSSPMSNDSVEGMILGCVIGLLFAGWGAIPGAIIGYFVGGSAIRTFVSTLISTVCGCACLIVIVAIVIGFIAMVFGK